MIVTVKELTGFSDAFESIYMSKGSWTPELAETLRRLKEWGDRPYIYNGTEYRFDSELAKVLKIGRKHTTILRFINISIMTNGISRGACDDIDSHAKRFENKIVRSSTRLIEFNNEKSSWFEGRIKSFNEVLPDIYGGQFPEKVHLLMDGKWVNASAYTGDPELIRSTWTRMANGYVKEGCKDWDSMRGSYPLSIPFNFISQINLCEWAHVFRLRCNEGHAHPEVKWWAEDVMLQITAMYPAITRDYVLSIEN